MLNYSQKAGYYRRFIENFSKIAKPLSDLTEVAFQWKDEQQKAFNKLRKALCSVPILQYPNYNEPFIIGCIRICDWCTSQPRKNRRRKIGESTYCLRIMSKTISRHNIYLLNYLRELLAFFSLCCKTFSIIYLRKKVHSSNGPQALNLIKFYLLTLHQD